MTFKKICVFLVFLPAVIFAHCQVPCGIYDDEKAFKTLVEHAHTIEKAISKINDPGTSLHQQVRWIQNKEKHATEIQDLMNHYFLIQRIQVPHKTKKSSSKKKKLLYLKKLTASHNILVLAMKNKQQNNTELVNKLKVAIRQFKKLF